MLRPDLGMGRRNGVVTSFGGRDLDWPEWCRDTDLMSLHGSGCPMEIGVATPIFEVATWAVLIGKKGGRDLRPRPAPMTWALCT